MPKVSIVLPVYNGEKYIRESIESIINQSFKDWELIIVNDCSTDSTKEIIEGYKLYEKRIKVIHNSSNKKLPASLNIGFINAKGEYLTWTSDDNIFLPNAISTLVEILEQDESVGMVCANMYLIDDSGVIIGEKRVGINDLCISNCIGACFLYRSDVRERIGEYDTSLFLVEDYDYWIRIEKEYGSILYCDIFLYKYRRHSESLSDKRTAQVKEYRARLREKHKDYILNKLKNNHKELFEILYENCKSGQKGLSINSEIIKINNVFMPLLTDITDITVVVVFGAGKYGKCFAEYTDKEILFFVDNNLEKINTTINNYVVKDINSLKTIDDNVYIVVAVSCKKMLKILIQLYNMGCKKIAVTF